MSHPQRYRDIEVPENFDEWSVDARVNFLGNVMDRQQLASNRVIRRNGELRVV